MSTSIIKAIQASLDTINALKGKRKTGEETKLYQEAFGFLEDKTESGICGISTMSDVADINVNVRYEIQYATIPSNKRGNLSPYAGKEVGIILTYIQNRSSRINYFIFETKK